ncbi:hypothetical protein JTB14_037326 [Gonioctena quinquepunctata]|nr:hypothetical protein JTB14_037326 [Gonioctena quinquepunctata]
MKVPSLLTISIFLFIIGGFNVDSKPNSTKKGNVKIVNGLEAEPHSLPYMVAIRTVIDDREILCGGSLISDSLVLTAAKCVFGATEAELAFGAHDLAKVEKSQVQMTSTEFIIHEKFRKDSMKYDIAIIELPAAVPLSEYIATIKIPKVNDIFTNFNDREGVVAGWGKTSDLANSTSNVLRTANLTIIPNIACLLSHALQISLEQMCTSGVSQKNICLGDSGGPLVVDGVQVGIASFGSDLGCVVGFPGVYTRLTSYLSWFGSIV